VTSERTGSWIRKDRRTQTARGVVVAAGALGTNQLLAQCKRDGRYRGYPIGSASWSAPTARR